MSLSRRASLLLKSAVLWTVMAVAVLCIVLAAIAFLAAAVFIVLAHHTGKAWAAAITGGALLLLALIIGLAGALALRRNRRRLPSLLSEFGSTLGMTSRLAALMVGKDPKKALIISVVAGALAEYILSERKR